MMPSQTALKNMSKLLDGDADIGAIGAGVAMLASDADAREAVYVYQLIGDALRGRAVADDGYSRRIIAALAAARPPATTAPKSGRPRTKRAR